MKQRSKAIWLLIIFLFTVPGMPLHAQQARLSDIVVTNTEEHLLVYFTVEDCFTTDMIRAIESGLPTTFTFYVRLNERREFWWDRTVVEVKVRHTVRYDQLKNLYELRISEDEDEVVTVEDFEEAKRLMSEVVALEVVPLARLHKGTRYRLRMMAELEKIRLPLYLHYVFFFLSLWNFETDWYAVDVVY
ncbi:MAG: DUF4390 domain-containing protein [Thermodesulfobacteriota bacterium]